MDFGEGLECIGVEAFYECTTLRHIIIPHAVKVIMMDAFHG